MNEQELINNASYYYSINLLKILLNMKLITMKDFDEICKISAKHYEANIYMS
jgi:hypothetical protein